VVIEACLTHEGVQRCGHAGLLPVLISTPLALAMPRLLPLVLPRGHSRQRMAVGCLLSSPHLKMNEWLRIAWTDAIVENALQHQNALQH